MKNLKLIRVTKNISLLTVKNATGISQSTLSRYENGKSKPLLKNVIILADYYNTSTDFLLDLTMQQKPWKRRKQ